VGELIGENTCCGVRRRCDERVRLKNCNLIVRCKASSRSPDCWVFNMQYSLLPPQLILLHRASLIPFIAGVRKPSVFSKYMQIFFAR